MLNFVNESNALSSYTHFFIIDSREAFHHASELYKTLRTLEHKAAAFNNNRLKKIGDIHKDNFTSFTKNFSLDDFDYAINFIHNPNSTNNTIRTSYYHIGKASGEERPLNGPELQFTPGSGTLFSLKSFKILDEYLSDYSNKSELFSVFRNFADDDVSAYILKKNHIYPTTYPFNIYMRNYDIYFPELAAKFEYISGNNNLQLYAKYQVKFKKINILSNKPNNFNDLANSYSMKRFIDELEVGTDSIDSIFIHLINNNFKTILLKYLYCKYDNFITKITKIHYKIKPEKYDDALNLLNTLECSSDSELYRKNIISFKLAKRWGNPELCRNIIDTLNLDNKKNADLHKKILSFLS